MPELAERRGLAGVPEPVTVRVPGKVNLHLSVGARRPDGFHDVTTVFQAVSVYDDVQASGGVDDITCTVAGEGREGRWAGTGKLECGLHVPAA